MEEGRIVALGTLDELSKQVVPNRLVRIALLKSLPVEEAQAQLTSIPGMSNVHLKDGPARMDWLTFDAEFSGDDEDLHKLLEALLRKKLPVVHFSEELQNLEKVFMQTTSGNLS